MSEIIITKMSPELLRAHARNWGVHDERQRNAVSQSHGEFGWLMPVLWNQRTGNIIDGHLRVELALSRREETVPVHVVDVDDMTELRMLATIKRTEELSGRDERALADILKEFRDDLPAGWEPEDLKALELESIPSAFEVEKPRGGGDDFLTLTTDAGSIPTRTRKGEVWQIGPHRVMCGDCREFGDIETLMDGQEAQVVMTSPPYASQRKYDEVSGFTPIDTKDYLSWFYDIQANLYSILSDAGSYFLNIKESCEEGQRSLYVKDLTIAHVREWNWFFVDEFCWQRSAPPGSWPNRFKNNWEPVFHFTKSRTIKFNPYNVSHESNAVPPHSSDVGACADISNGKYWNLPKEREEGQALPGNVIEAHGVQGGTGHQAAFPVALPSFFIQAFSDEGDVVFDPFAGSGTTLIAAEKAGRIGYGIEISPKYCDVILSRMEAEIGQKACLLVEGVEDDGTV